MKKIPWGVISVATTIIGTCVDFMSNKDNEDLREKELEDIRERLNKIENSDNQEVTNE